MAASTYYVISKEVENHILKYNWIFRDLCTYKQPTLTKQTSEIIIFLWIYTYIYKYFWYTGRPFLGCAIFVAHINIIWASCETKKEGLSYRKKCIEEFLWGTSIFLTVRPPFYTFVFFAFFVYSSTFPYIILLWVIFCVMISWVNGRKYENLLQFNTGWLASLRTWYYFMLCFSSSCFGYDLTLIKNSHNITCYSKTKTYKMAVGNCDSSVYCKNDKFRKSYRLFVTHLCLVW